MGLSSGEPLASGVDVGEGLGVSSGDGVGVGVGDGVGELFFFPLLPEREGEAFGVDVGEASPVGDGLGFGVGLVFAAGLVFGVAVGDGDGELFRFGDGDGVGELFFFALELVRFFGLGVGVGSKMLLILSPNDCAAARGAAGGIASATTSSRQRPTL